MEKNNNIESLELEEMRQQMSELKQQLDKKIDLRESLFSKMIRKQRKNVYPMWYVLLICIIIGWNLDCIFGFSLIYCIVLLAFSMLMALLEYKITHTIKPTDYVAYNTTGLLKKIIKTKKNYRTKCILQFILIFPMLLWTCYELYYSNFFYDAQTSYLDFYICIVMFVIAGISIFYFNYKKKTREIDELLMFVGGKEWFFCEYNSEQ